MEVEVLKRHLDNPEVQRQALAGHEGLYSLTARSGPGGRGAVLALEVEERRAPYPKTVLVNGEAIPLVVESGSEQATAPRQTSSAQR